MAIGVYDRFKDPFFNVFVSNSKGDTFVELPEQLRKLIQKIEITESLVKCDHSLLINITMLEGSREPYPVDAGADTSSLYDLGTNSGDAIENRTGIVPDLRFTESGNSLGITSLGVDAITGLVDDAINNPTIITSPGAVADLSKFPFGFTSKDNITVEKSEKGSEAPKFLFEERNRVRITWGYLSDLTAVRTVDGYVQAIQSDFPEAGQPTTTITVSCPRAFIDQKATGIGVKFSNKTISFSDPSAGPQFVDEDIPTGDLIRNACSQAGIDCIVSAQIEGQTVDKDHVKVWPAGMSFDQFLKKLANQHDAYYVSVINPSTNRDTIAFITREEFEQKLTIEDTSLFIYKGANSILKSASIRAAFNVPVGTGAVGIDNEGNKIGAAVTNPKEKVVLYEGGGLVDQDPTSHNPVQAAKGVSENVGKNLKGNTGDEAKVSVVEYTPETEASGITNQAKSSTNCQYKKSIALEFTTVGFTRLTPGVIQFGGLGLRFSGKYSVMNVTHIIEPNGYTCRGTATGATIFGNSGVVPSGATKGTEPQEKESFELFDSIKISSVDVSDVGSVFESVTSGDDAKKKYDELKGLA